MLDFDVFQDLELVYLKTLKKEMNMCDWEVTSRDKASMVENPPGQQSYNFLHQTKAYNCTHCHYLLVKGRSLYKSCQGDSVTE